MERKLFKCLGVVNYMNEYSCRQLCCRCNDGVYMWRNIYVINSLNGEGRGTYCSAMGGCSARVIKT